MLLFAGLGNPGSKYAGHRHNVGFMAVNAIAERFGFSPERSQFKGRTREGFIEAGARREKVLILKPETFMNDSGQSIGEASRFFQIEPEQVFVFYDELDLAPGKVRLKLGGGAAGHNGIRSTKAHLDGDFWRVRIGIGHPGHKDRVTGHVLNDFSKAERELWVTDVLDAIARSAGELVLADDSKFMSEVARLSPPPKLDTKDDD